MGVATIAGRGWWQVIPIIRTIRAATMARAMRIQDLWEFMAGTDGGRVITVVFMGGVAFAAERVLGNCGNKSSG